MILRRSLGFASHKLGVAWAVPLAVFIWRCIKFLRHRSSSSARQGDQEGSHVEEEALEDVLLPPTERVWEMYDEDAVEGLHAASEDPMLMAALMRE